MAPKKAPRTEKATAATGSNDASLTAAFITGADDTNVLSRLLASSTALEALPTAGGHSLPKAFVEAVAQRQFTAHPTADVRILAATVLAEAVRVSATSATGAAAAQALPLKGTALNDTVKLWIEVTSRLRSDGNGTANDYIRHLVEVLAASHALAGLLPAATGIKPDAVTGVIDALITYVPADADDAFIGAAAYVIADCMAATGSVTEAQMQALMNGIAGKVGNPNGHRIVAGVLRRQEDMLAVALADFVTAAFTDACEGLHKIDVTGGEPNERKSAARRVNGVAHLVPEIAKSSAVAVGQVLPAMAKLFDSVDQPDGRVSLVAALGACFIAIPALASEFPAAYGKTIAAINDARPNARLAALNVATELLKTHSASEAFWAQLAKPISQKLTDHDEGVRKTAILAVVSLAEHAPARIPPSMLESVGLRCIDRRPNVRALAIERLSQLYREVRPTASGSKVRFVPSAILQSINLEGGANVPLVDGAIAAMLPHPNRTAATAAAAAPGTKKGGKKALKRATSAFDFGAKLDDDDDVNGAGDENGATSTTFVAGIVRLCMDIDTASASPAAGRACFDTVETLFRKRAQLRTVVKRFFELRGEVKRAEEGSEARKAKTTQIGRLLEFLSTMTHAKGEETWAGLLRMKDEKAVKAMLHLCSADCDDFRSAMSDASARVKACTSKEVNTFVEKQLMPRIAVPLCSEHVAEVVATVRDSAASRQRSGEEQLALYRAIYLMGAAAPHLIAASETALSQLIDQLVDESRAHKVEDEPATLQLLKVFALVEVDSETGAGPAEIADRSSDIISALGRVAIQSVNPAVAKKAASVMTALFPKTKKAFTQLFRNVLERVNEAATGNAGDLKRTTPSWVKTLQILIRELPSAFASQIDDVIDAVTRLLTTALPLSSGDDELAAKSKRSPALPEASSPLSQLVDCCVKCLSACVAAIPNASVREPKLTQLAQTLFSSFAATRSLDSGTIGAGLRRLALHKQLVKLFLQPALDLKVQLRAAMFISAEHNAYVRGEVQKCISKHITRQRCDMRMFGLLCLTGVSEDSRQTYSRVRSVIQAVGDRLRHLQAQNSTVSLSEPRALLLFPEYAIPFVVLVLAHHSFYESEAESNFVGYQRVWHLLLDEILRAGPQVVSFVMDLLRKIRVFDDSIAPDSDRTRVVCDLAINVLTAILSMRSLASDTIKPYPGTILLPPYFSKPASADAFPADKVYLPEGVQVSHQVMFRIPVSTKKDGAASDAEGSDVDGGDAPADAYDVYSETPARADAGRSKSRRAQTPPPGAATPAAGRRGNQGGKSGQRGRSGATPMDESEGSNTIERKLEFLVKKRCAGKTRAELMSVNWGTLTGALSDDLGIELSKDLKNLVLNVLHEQIDGLAEDE